MVTRTFSHTWKQDTARLLNKFTPVVRTRNVFKISFPTLFADCGRNRARALSGGERHWRRSSPSRSLPRSAVMSSPDFNFCIRGITAVPRLAMAGGTCSSAHSMKPPTRLIKGPTFSPYLRKRKERERNREREERERRDTIRHCSNYILFRVDNSLSSNPFSSLAPRFISRAPSLAPFFDVLCCLFHHRKQIDDKT